MFANLHPHPGYHVTDFDEAYKMRGIAWSSPFSALIKAMFPSSRTIGPQELNANDHGKPDTMAPIDYSKWNNIDADSEGENFPASRPRQRQRPRPPFPRLQHPPHQPRPPHQLQPPRQTPSKPSSSAATARDSSSCPGPPPRSPPTTASSRNPSPHPRTHRDPAGAQAPRDAVHQPR